MRTAEAGGGSRAIGGSGVSPGKQSAPPGQQSNPASEFLEAAAVPEVRA
jgi:hypothetical protein